MKKEWFSTTELTGVAGLPTTIQGINQKARREEWKSRKRKGVQGKAVEYHLDSLPEEVKHRLLVRDARTNYVYEDQQMVIWLTAYQQLTNLEKEQLINFIIRHGISYLVSKLSENMD